MNAGPCGCKLVVWIAKSGIALIWMAVIVFGACSVPSYAQSCESSVELEDAPRTALTAAAQRYFAMAAKGDAASMRQNAIATLASDFSGVESTVKDHQQELSGAQSTVKSVFLLEEEGSAPIPKAEFFCGVFGKNGQTANSAVFYFDNLAPGKYGVVLLDATSAKGKDMISVILQQAGSDWKLGGLYIKHATVGGHDSEWFLARAREYKAKGQAHNAYFYYLQARSLISPVNFMSTQAIDKLYDEAQSALPADLPGNGKTADLSAGTSTYKLTAMFPDSVGDDLDLVVRYEAADISNTTQAYQSNLAVMKALAAKYPELRDGFAGMVARAVDPSGHDYGTLQAMKDIK